MAFLLAVAVKDGTSLSMTVLYAFIFILVFLNIGMCYNKDYFPDWIPWFYLFILTNICGSIIALGYFIYYMIRRYMGGYGPVPPSFVVLYIFIFSLIILLLFIRKNMFGFLVLVYYSVFISGFIISLGYLLYM